jgi:hypothetical protein
MVDEPVTARSPTGQSSRTRYFNAPRPLLPSFSTLSVLIKYLLLKSFNAPPKNCCSSKMAVSGESCDWSRHSLVFRFRESGEVIVFLIGCATFLTNICKGNQSVGLSVVTSYQTVAREMRLFCHFLLNEVGWMMFRHSRLPS